MIGPGSYGRNDSGDAVMDAAVLSKAVGKPVRVQGMRYEGTAGTRRRPPRSTSSRAADRQGRQGDRLAVRNQSVLQARHAQQRGLARAHARRPAHGLAAQAGACCSAIRTRSYDFASMHKISATIAPLLDRASPLRTAHLRDPGGPQTHFAVESFMDELALRDSTWTRSSSGCATCSNARDIAVIKAAAEKAGWQPRVGARKQIKGDVYVGQGIAYASRGGTARRHRRRSRGQPHDRQGVGQALHGGARLRADHRARSPAAHDRGQHRAEHQPRALGRGEVRRKDASPAPTGRAIRSST